MNSHRLRVCPARQDQPRPVPLRVRLALLLGAVAALAAATPTAFYAPLGQAGLWALCAFTVALLVGLVAARCVSEPLLALARDVSARHTVEAALRASEAQYRSVVESVREIVFQVDADGNWTFLNPAWTALTEYTVEETLGRPFINFVHPDDRARIQEAFNARISQQAAPGRTEVRYQTRSGGTRWMERLSSVMLGPDRQVRGLSGTLMDVTERRHAEAARVRMLIREQEARDHQERAAEVTGIVQHMPCGVLVFDTDARLDAALVFLDTGESEPRLLGADGDPLLVDHVLACEKERRSRRYVLQFSSSAGASPVPPCPEMAIAIGHHVELVVRGRVVGVLELYGTEKLTAVTADALASLAAHAVSAFENAHLYREVGDREQRLQDALRQLLIAQEALTNVRKHAQTLAATVSLRRYDGHVELAVVDRGVGFRQFAGRDDARPGQQIGLVGMRERAALVGGLCLVQSQPDDRRPGARRPGGGGAMSGAQAGPGVDGHSDAPPGRPRRHGRDRADPSPDQRDYADDAGRP